MNTFEKTTTTAETTTTKKITETERQFQHAEYFHVPEANVSVLQLDVYGIKVLLCDC